jgi:hypothetical protein
MRMPRLVKPALRKTAAVSLWLVFAVTLIGPLENSGCCDVPVPASVLNPATPEEAWNVISLAMSNVEKLLAESRLEEIPSQISLCSPALRTLARTSQAGHEPQAIADEAAQTQAWVNAIAKSATEDNLPVTQRGFQAARTSLLALSRHFDSRAVNAEISICPMHPDVLSARPGADCRKCGMGLIARRIPYSFIYTKPGEPTIVLSASASGPCEAGKKLDVTVRLSRRDQSPVLLGDLMVMHTQPIHLLIQEPGLSDYHHEHPLPTGVPGEYQFSFTPARSSSYRIWADLVPVAVGVQELPRFDLPSDGPRSPVEDTGTRLTSSVEGYEFTLALPNGEDTPVPAGKTSRLSISVHDPIGRPVTTLEPVMNAFAHLVGFYDDYETVVHLHPSGGDILNPQARGGPSLNFQFFPPKSGFIRLYCQVKIGGRMLFVPFNLKVVP